MDRIIKNQLTDTLLHLRKKKFNKKLLKCLYILARLYGTTIVPKNNRNKSMKYYI